MCLLRCVRSEIVSQSYTEVTPTGIHIVPTLHTNVTHHLTAK